MSKDKLTTKEQELVDAIVTEFKNTPLDLHEFALHRYDGVKEMWLVNVFEGEISIVRHSNHHGFYSYGWGGKDKKIVWNKGHGVEDVDQDIIDMAILSAHKLANKLNDKEGNP